MFFLFFSSKISTDTSLSQNYVDIQLVMSSRILGQRAACRSEWLSLKKHPKKIIIIKTTETRMEASPHSPALKKKTANSQNASAKYVWSWFFGRKFCFSSSWTSPRGRKKHVKINGRQPVPVDDDTHVSKLGKNGNSWHKRKMNHVFLGAACSMRGKAGEKKGPKWWRKVVIYHACYHAKLLGKQRTSCPLDVA